VLVGGGTIILSHKSVVYIWRKIMAKSIVYTHFGCIMPIVAIPTESPKSLFGVNLMRKFLAFLFPVLVLALTVPVQADPKSFADLVGNVAVQPVKPGPVTECPYMSWGGDLPLLVANGNAFQTQHGSAYDKLGLNLKFYHQDEFSEQVKDYLSGRTPYLRCTYSMLGPASEILNKDPRTKPRVFLFVSWSQGDHLVSKAEFKTLNDLIRPRQLMSRMLLAFQISISLHHCRMGLPRLQLNVWVPLCPKINPSTNCLRFLPLQVPLIQAHKVHRR
jgi:hypothetical protein